MSVIEVRSHKQAAVSKLISKLVRHVTQAKVGEVKTTITKLNSAFDEYETAHEEVLASIIENQTKCDSEDKEFIQMEMNYVESLKAANKFLKDDTPRISTDIAYLLNIPKVEIHSFDGTPSRYLSFVAIFDETVGKTSIDGQSKLTRLLQYTTGQARAAIDCCALIGGTEGYKEARRVLQERFGNPYIITTALLEKLKEHKDVRDPAALRSLADELNSASIVLKSMNMYSELDNQHHIKEVGARLSTELWNKWCERVFKIKRKQKRYASFEEFVSFVTEKADEANDPVYGETAAAVHYSSPRAHPSTSATRSTSHSSVIHMKSEKPCILCQVAHPLYLCPEFKMLNVVKRIEFVNNHNLCSNCLWTGHRVEDCHRNVLCGINGCSVKHSRFLHQNNIIGNAVGNTEASNVCMPIVRVITNKVPDIYCILDTGSSSSFISANLVSKLRLPTTPTSINLETLNNTMSKKTDLVNLTVDSVNHDFSVDMENILVTDSIPTRSYNVDVEAYSHLQDLDIINTCHQRVDLLIGQDYARCFRPLDVRSGNENEPYAVKTPLGYVLNGASSSDVSHNSTVSHLTTTSFEVQPTLVDKQHSILIHQKQRSTRRRKKRKQIKTRLKQGEETHTKPDDDKYLPTVHTIHAEYSYNRYLGHRDDGNPRCLRRHTFQSAGVSRRAWSSSCPDDVPQTSDQYTTGYFHMGP